MWTTTENRANLKIENDGSAFFSSSGRGLSTSKLFPRGTRAETRNRAKDELRRVINAVERVRKWEKRWVALKDSAISVYKWVPVTGQTITPPKPANTAVTSALPNNSSENSLPTIAAEEDTNVSISAENSNGETNNVPTSRGANFTETNGEENEDSNPAFFSNEREAIEAGEVFDSDSNQTESYDRRINYGATRAHPDEGATRTDFSVLVAEEEEAQRLKRIEEIDGSEAAEEDEGLPEKEGDDSSDIPAKRRRLED